MLRCYCTANKTDEKKKHKKKIDICGYGYMQFIYFFFARATENIPISMPLSRAHYIIIALSMISPPTRGGVRDHVGRPSRRYFN